MLGVVVGMVISSPSSAQPSQDELDAITKSDAAMLQFYPADARAKGVEGTAIIKCKRSPKGAFRDCVLDSEHPSGAGFGQAALNIAAAAPEKSRIIFTPEEASRPQQIVLFFELNPPAVRPDLFLPFLRGTPQWVDHATDADLAKAYPFAAGSGRFSGRAQIDCLVTKTGTIDHCVLLSEDPRGLGFGEAAMKLADRYRLTAVTDLGFSVEGFAMAIGFNFHAPQLDAETFHRNTATPR